MDVRPSWSQLEGRELSATEIVRLDWWTEFGDEYLDGLIAEAVDQSSDLRAKALQLDLAGIDLGEARRDRLPEFTTDISRQRQRSDTGSSFTRTADLRLSWELDVWGKIRKQAKAQNASYLATEMDWRATHLTLVSSVAQLYFTIRLLDEQISQQEIALEQTSDLLRIYEAQFNEGMVPETTILNQKAQVSQLTQQLMEQRRSRDESELRLATLIGRHAGDLEVPVEPLRVAVELPEVPGVLPADMLARRPDVLAVEYRLLEKHHLLGRARLARLPTFNLNGAISALTGAWSVGLVESVSTLFDRETGVAVKRSEIERDVLVEEYRKTVLSAFEEVEIALLNLQARRRQMEQLSEQIAALEVVHRVQTERLKEGFVSQLELFQTEQNLLTAQQGMLSTYQQILTDTVTLYKALGGGWPKQTVHEDATVRRAASVEQMQQK